MIKITIPANSLMRTQRILKDALEQLNVKSDNLQGDPNFKVGYAEGSIKTALIEIDNLLNPENVKKEDTDGQAS